MKSDQGWQLKWGNESIIDQLENELPQSTIYWLLISIVAAITWIVYLSYYNSRVVGLIFTVVLNKFVKYGHIKLGSFSISVLSGKVMFRDFHFVTEDYSVRVPHGYLIFRWWRPLMKKDISDGNVDKPHTDTRLTVYMDSFEFHVYNKSATYSRLEHLFGLDQFMVPGSYRKEDESKTESKSDEERVKATPKQVKWQWRDLIPVIKFEIVSGKLIFGNYLLPTTLSVNFGYSHITYTTKPASTPFDDFMHTVKWNADHVRVMMVPSPKHQGVVEDEPPRYMGDGFVVLLGNHCDIYYYHDEAGIVPYEPELVQLANGDVIARRTWPCFGMDIKCGKGTDLSYGPWADRQREYLWKFFFPPDFQALVPTEYPLPGQRRIFKSFDFKMSMQEDATFDVLFTKNRETQAVHMSMAHGSYLEFTIPWITDETGFISKVNAQMMHLEATTSLPYRQFIKCETFEVDVEASYSLNWNDYQDWKCNITACKATGNIVFHHKVFLMDLVEDWSTKSRPDIYHFVPYAWKVNILLKEFEVITKCTEYNWIDCFGQTPENSQVALCGETFDLAFALPFTDFLPEKLALKFTLKAETGDLRMYLPETNTSRNVVLAISENMKIVDRNGVTMDAPFKGLFSDCWRGETDKSAGWVDIWTTPIVTLAIMYTYHPMPPTGENSPKMPVISPISTPDAEERLLIPLRMDPGTSAQRDEQHRKLMNEFDASTLTADLIEIDLEIGPSILCVYGCLPTTLYDLKENYLGEDQKFTDYNEAAEMQSDFESVIEVPKEKSFDERKYRPFAVKVNAALHDIQAHLVKNSNEGDPPCPCAHIEKLVFELDKFYEQTILQVLVSPGYLVMNDNFKLRPDPHKHVSEGHLALSGLQIRGHAMFSHKGLPLEAETLEYGWLMEVTVGDVTGRITSSHMQNVVEILQTFIFLVVDSENHYQKPLPYRACQHGEYQPDCSKKPSAEALCVSGEDIKYRMTRFSVDCIDLYLAEAGTALNIQVYPVRFSMCNLHGKNDEAGVSAIIPNINLRQFVLSVPISQTYGEESDYWLEAGGVCLGPIMIDAAMALPNPQYHKMQDKFLKLHDEKTKRLWFLWTAIEQTKDNPKLQTKCGCVGNCKFFGNNRNGLTYFQPSDKDFSNGVCTAVHHICVDEDNIGYGQSLLNENQLVFTRIPGPLFLSTPTRNFLANQRVKDTIVMEEVGSRNSSVVEELSPHHTGGAISDTTIVIDPETEPDCSFETTIVVEEPPVSDKVSPAPSIRRPEVLELKKGIQLEDEIPLIKAEQGITHDVCSPTDSLVSASSSVPSEYLPLGTIPDAYDETDKSEKNPVSANSASVSSLPDMVDFKKPKKQLIKGHERKSSYESPVNNGNGSNPGLSISRQNSKSPVCGFVNQNSLQDQSTESRSSLKSSQHSLLSHTSSLTSPVFRRLSQREGSLISMDSVATFVSAKEDVSDTVSNWSHQRLTSDLSMDNSFNDSNNSADLPPPTSASMGESDPLWFAVDRDSTMDTVIAKSVSVHIGNQTSSSAQSSSSDDDDSLASFMSAVSSQGAGDSKGERDETGRSRATSDVTYTRMPSSSSLNAVDEKEGLVSQPSQDDSYIPNIDVKNIPSAGNYVDLHGQMNQPITKSPLLMSCYTTHMTKLKCSHWSAQGPHPHGKDKVQPQQNRPSTSGSSYLTRQTSLSTNPSQSLSWIPQYVYTREGFTPSLMVNKREPLFPPNLDCHSAGTAESDKTKQKFFADSTEDMHNADCSLVIEDEVSKTTAVVNLKGSVDVMISPLMLEALQRYVESVTPVLESLHPSSIVDSIHFHCSSAVKAQNKLKDAQPEVDTSLDKSKGEINAKGKRTSMVSSAADSECKTSRLQVMFSLSRINLCILQSSLVEEMIPFSGLDRVQELTCVSVLAVCLDSIDCQVLLSNQSKKAIEGLGAGGSSNNQDSAGMNSTVIKRISPPDTLKKQESQNEDEPSETQLEDIVGKLHIGRIHFQLRRLKKNSNFSDNVFLTAIPEHRSKVLFTFKSQEHHTIDRQSLLRSREKYTSGYASDNICQEFDEVQDQEDIAGFIMVECGLEDITLKAARRKGYPDASQDKEDYAKKIEEVLNEMSIDETSQGDSRSANISGAKSSACNSEVNEVRNQVDEISTRSQDGSQCSDADDEASWTSRISLDSEGGLNDDDKNKKDDEPTATTSDKASKSSGKNDMKEVTCKKELTGDASSCLLEFKNAWFNFAAPPSSSAKKRKLEFTRYDWNLLSTVTPAINAWMNPCHRAIVSAHTLVKKLDHRTTTVMACVMAEALDRQGIHVPAKSRYNKITPLSRVLQEDPSCQLLTVLRRYIREKGAKHVEENVASDTVPQLLTIQKGLLALVRQWKTRLYMPADSTTFKKKKVTPYTVTFAPVVKDETQINHLGDMEGPSLENLTDVDEKTSLLKAEGGSIQRESSCISVSASLPYKTPEATLKATSPLDDQQGTSSSGHREPDVFPGRKHKVGPSNSAVNGTESPTKKQSSSQKTVSQHQEMSYAKPYVTPGSGVIKRIESHTSFHSVSQSLSDIPDAPIMAAAASVPGTPLRHSLTRHLSELEKREDEDMYVWTLRQQEYTKINHPHLHNYPSMGQESFMNTGVSEFSQDDALSLQRLTTTMPQGGFPVADAQILFKPLLRAIGLHLGEVKTSAIMKKLGCDLSVTAIMKSLRVDIVDSETSTKRKSSKGKGKAKRNVPRFHIETGLDTPAFFCDTFNAMINLKDIVNFEKKIDDDGDGSLSSKKRSSRTINIALDGFEAKPTTTKINFAVNVHEINQHVNMSLLRLVHQFVTMIMNIVETRTELKGLTSTDAFKGHRKQDSKGSSTDTGEDTTNPEQPEFPNLAGMHLGVDIEPPSPVILSNEEVNLCCTESSPSHLQPSTISPEYQMSTPILQPRPDNLHLSMAPVTAAVKRPKVLQSKVSKYEILSSKSTPEAIEMKPHFPEFEESPPRYGPSVSIDIGGDTSSPAVAEKTIVDEIKENTPQCWKTLYALLDLYSTVPEPKTVYKPTPSRLSIIDEEPERGSQSASMTHGSEQFQRSSMIENIEMLERQPECSPTEERPMTASSAFNTFSSRPYTAATFTQSVVIGERIPLVILGLLQVKNVKMSAMLSGLKLEADLKNVNTSATHRERVKGMSKRKSQETSVTTHVGHAMIVLLEGVAPSMQTVVTVNIGKSHGLYSSVIKKQKDHNSALVTLGKVDIDIPQHPGVLHGMVSRSSKRLSTTLQEFMRPPNKSRSFDVPDSAIPSAQPSRSADLISEQSTQSIDAAQRMKKEPEIQVEEEEETAKPLVIHLKAVLKGLAVGASLLPSLRAQYQIGQVMSSGITGKKARFVLDLPSHSLSFSSKMPAEILVTDIPIQEAFNKHSSSRRASFRSLKRQVSTPVNLPEAASIDLPPIHMHAEYRPHDPESPGPKNEGGLAEGLVLREGSYLHAMAEVGLFSHCLTTDLLNHLVFVQKIFMKEINEVVTKISGVDQPVSIWGDESCNTAPVRPLLYSLFFRLKGIQITATTPTNSAVRLETSTIDLNLSNRVYTAVKMPIPTPKHDRLKVFVNLQLDLNLALGMLLKNAMFEEAEPEFQQLATFDTRISMRNALQDELIPGSSKEQEALLISLKRPVISVMPSAFDKAVLVWLNYKNAYEYWTEQRLAQIKELLTPSDIVSQHILDRTKGGGAAPSTSNSGGGAAQALGTLFLQLTVDDLGVCLPMSTFSPTNSKLIEDTGAPALVLTLENTQISACSFGSLVSKGKFVGFCLRFANDFELTWDDWKPDKSLDVVMNAMVVPEGTYEVCSRTINAAPDDPLSNAKWILNVKWKMEGMDIHLNTDIGKRLSVLADTLTSLGGGEQYEKDMAENNKKASDDLPAIKVNAPSRQISAIPEGMPDFVYDTTLDNRVRARLIETEMNQQAAIVSDLKQLGASQNTIEVEELKYKELENALFIEFRQDLLKKIKKQSNKATALKDKLGLGYKPSHVRSKSTGHQGHLYQKRKGSDGSKTFTSMSDTSSKGIDPYIPESDSSESSDGHSRNLSLDVSHSWKEDEQHVHWDVSPGAQSTKSHEHMSTTIDDPTQFRISSDSSKTPTPNTPPYNPSSFNEIFDSSSSATEESACSPPKHTQSDGNYIGSYKVPSPTGSLKPVTTVQEPSVDFELDIKVDIDSGQCVLHPKDKDLKDEAESKSKKDPRYSPRSERKKGTRKFNLDTSARGYQLQPPTVDSRTLFFLPGVDIKVHYGSKTTPVSENNSPANTLEPGLEPPKHDNIENAAFKLGMISKDGAGLKKANLYAWISLQQLSEEMLITPSLLDFLEQALEPIPAIPLVQTRPVNKSSNATSTASSSTSAMPLNLDESTASLATTSYAYTSFPVDVVVYIRVQPSLIRFSCLPVSRVECLLRMPSVDVVFSTKKADVEANQLAGDGTPPVKLNRNSESSSRMHASSTLGATPSQSHLFRTTSNTSRSRNLSGIQQDPSSGGLSVSACMADFSFYIFHPYGGGATHTKRPDLSLLENTFKKSSLGTMNLMGTSPVIEMGRKDSLSLNVEFVKVNISRTRKGLLHSEGSGSGAFLNRMSESSHTQQKAANIVRFSALCDVGSASFKYDMRRLSEILALPKAWYRRTLARRLFLGEETAVVEGDSDDENDSILSATPESPVFNKQGKDIVPPVAKPGGKVTHKRSASSDLKPQQQFQKEVKKPNEDKLKIKIPQSPDSLKLRSSLLSPSSPLHPMARHVLSDTTVLGKDFESLAKAQIHSPSTSMGGGGKAYTDWETLVLFAVNLSQLDVAVNMSNVMGNTVWSTKDLKTQGQLSIDSSGYRNMKITSGLSGSRVDAKGGIVGGYVEIHQLNTVLSIKEDPGQEPDHRLGFQMKSIETKLDYMGSSVLMARISDMAVQLSDEWRVDHGEEGQPLATKRPALIFVNGVFSWDKVHVMISRSTTPDLIKMFAKLDEFFTQQLTSGKRALSAFGPLTSRNKRKMSTEHEASWISEIKHHRHWQRVLEHIAGCKFSNLTFTLPQQGTILGGTMSLHGSNLTLACFHGINFRSKSWALFTMEEPLISFSTESQDIQGEEGAKCTHIIQHLSYQLGSNTIARKEKRHMAYICKLSRGHYMPPPFTNVADWFHYAFATSEIKDLDSFPQLESLGSPTSADAEKPERKSRKGQEYNHETEVIFVLPPLQMVLKTEHLQEESEPEETECKPIVDCSFVTEFEDHIFVAMDAEVLLFLHDLIMSYVKEKDRGAEKIIKSPDLEKKDISNPTTVLKLDYRDFRCNTWHLEPTIRLISWAGKRIEPVGVDYILQKLGFQHARLTVPKWMQRGCMDPLDKVLAILMDKLIIFLKEDQEQSQKICGS